MCRHILSYFSNLIIIPECDANTTIKSCMSGDFGSADFGSIFLNDGEAVSMSKVGFSKKKTVLLISQIPLSVKLHLSVYFSKLLD